ncbi:hypothetical protein [Mycobacterium sp. DL592]|uniref:hypothetical protein n=1 Tax=Mycobacterium sp. DL592 TaxID=2675524 RepID=UPI001AAEFB45|nr:hypothetical protein [Mycobacterium sp. DL592]
MSDEFGGLVLEDPALFDAFLVRVVEDLDVCQQMTAGYLDRSEIDERVSARAFSTLDSLNRPALAQRGGEFGFLFSAQNGSESPDILRAGVYEVVRTYIRGPLEYSGSSLGQFANVVTAVAYDALSTGGRHAREDETDVVSLRHWLPACERWPWPLNRFC